MIPIAVFVEDGHAPSLLLGGILGLILRGNSRQITAYPQVVNEIQGNKTFSQISSDLQEKLKIRAIYN